MACNTMLLSYAFLLITTQLLAGFAPPVAVSGDGLVVGFYNDTCSTAESLVQKAVADAFASNPGVAAGLIRMHFHDCFVRGCDGSVLLNTVGNNTAEKDAAPNNPSLRGFEVIDAAKSAVEKACPGVVSCADILAFAARDSVALSGNVTYQVLSGRRDGRVSNATEALINLPRPDSNASQLIDNFAAKNLTARDMAVLSGAHTLGVAHCSAFVNRLYNGSTPQVDSTLSSAYGALLQSICPSNSSQFFPNTTTAMDLSTPTVLDNRYYVLLQMSLGLFKSDAALLTTTELSSAVQQFVDSQTNWLNNFTTAMVKMGNIEVLTGTAGEIRLNCSVVNSGSSSKASAGNIAKYGDDTVLDALSMITSYF